MDHPVVEDPPTLAAPSGVDNMFVTTQSFQNVDSGPGGALPLEERFGLTMKHAGVTITITTLTSFIAFAIGATTVRALRVGARGAYLCAFLGTHVRGSQPLDLFQVPISIPHNIAPTL